MTAPSGSGSGGNGGGGRELGRVRGAAPGPTLIVIGGMHGNEPAGVDAARRVLARVAAAGGPAVLAGELVAFAAHPEALAAGRRYLVRDLNRAFTEAGVNEARAAALGAADTADAETVAVAELAGSFEEILARRRGPAYGLDLHTTSAPGLAFAIVGDGAADRALAAHVPVPGIVGMAETLDGILSRWLGARDCPALAIEGGQHASADAAEHLEAVVLVALVALGLVAAAALPEAAAAGARLAAAAAGLPRLIEVAFRHEVTPDSGFRMEPGFANIQRTPAGTLLAHDKTGEIRAPYDGLVLLPLYQALGKDGFFYGREVTPPTS